MRRTRHCTHNRTAHCAATDCLCHDVRLLGRISDGSNIASVLDLSSYCGSRLARYGADFRALLPPLFEQRVVALMQEQWAAAAAQFYADVTSWDWAYRVSFHDEAGGSASGGTTTSASAHSTRPAHWRHISQLPLPLVPHPQATPWPHPSTSSGLLLLRTSRMASWQASTT